MKIFIDSANLDEIEQAYSYGILDGITTNPSLIKKAVDKLKGSGKKIDMKSYIKSILLAARGTPVSLEVVGTDYENMIKEAKRLFTLFNQVANNVCIKIPVNPSIKEGFSEEMFDGIKVIRELSNAKIPVNCTLIFTPEQALLAAKAGAKYVSPFVGRLDDYIRSKNNIKFGKADYYPCCGLNKDDVILDDNGIVSGIDLVGQCVEILRKYNLKTEVISASIRNARQARESALAGADIATLPLEVIRELITHPKTAEGIKSFSADIVFEYSELLKDKK